MKNNQIAALRGVLHDAVQDGILDRQFVDQVIELVGAELGDYDISPAADKPPDGPGGGG